MKMSDLFIPHRKLIKAPLTICDANHLSMGATMRSILLWLLGVPIPIIILIALLYR